MEMWINSIANDRVLAMAKFQQNVLFIFSKAWRIKILPMNAASLS